MSDTENGKPGFKDTISAVGEDVVEALDKAVDSTTRFIGGENGNKLVGGAAVGAIAGIFLPVTIIGGALLGAGYAAYRAKQKS